MRKLIRSVVFISTFAALSNFCSAPALGQLAPLGGFVLSPMGDSYSVPLQLPQGAGKVMPSLSLSYSSQLPKGISATGWGWMGFLSFRGADKMLVRKNSDKALFSQAVSLT